MEAVDFLFIYFFLLATDLLFELKKMRLTQTQVRMSKIAGRKETGIDEKMKRIRRQNTYTEEARLMELLADEEADEERIPDDGELEGSGDDFDGH